MKPEKDIYQALKQNRAITLGALVLAFVSVLASLSYGYFMHRQAMKQILMVNSQGQVIPARLANREETLKIEIQDFLNDWFQSYYTYDLNNLEEQREKGLWLISGDDGKKLEKFYTESGWFTEVKRYSLSQETELLPQTLKITPQKGLYGFQAIGRMRLQRGGNVTEYYLRTSGFLREVSRSFPQNPHGFLIINYQHGELQKIENTKP